MILSAIVAVSENNAIGKDNELPWHLPADLRFFKKTTMGKPVLMGRKTFESIGKALPGRLNIVLSRQKDLTLPEGVLLYNSLSEAMERLASEPVDEAFVIGGAHIFRETMNDWDRIYLTLVHTKVEDATAFFPDIDHSHWKLAWKEDHQPDEKNQFACTFQQLERISL